MRKLMSLLLVLAMLSVCLVPASAETVTFANAQKAVSAFDEYGVDYVCKGLDKDGDDKVVVTYQSEVSEYIINYFFTEDDETVYIRVWDLIAFQSYDRSAVIETLNEQNSSYNFVRFYADDDDTVTASLDIIVRPSEDIGDIIIESLVRIVRIMDKVYPELAGFNK